MYEDEIKSAFSRIKTDADMKERVERAVLEKEKNKYSFKKSRYLTAIAACVAVVGMTSAFAASPAAKGVMSMSPEYMGIIWITAIIAFVIAEAVTYQLVTIWFAIGALGALICTVTGAPVPIQGAVFILLSTAALMLVRPLSLRCLRQRSEKTNAASLIGMEVMITETVNNITACGRGKLRGIEWTLRSADNKEIAVGETAVVERIEGVKLIVSRKESKK